MYGNNISLEHKAIEDEIINYWKEIHKEIGTVLKDLSGTVLLTHSSLEFTNFVGILNRIKPERFQNVLYISLIRSYDFMRSALNKTPLDNKRIFFIDCVSGFAFPEEENIDDAHYHKPPSDLDQLKELIRFGIDKSDPDIVVIDSLSQFINFSRPTESEIDDLYKFLHTIRSGSLNVIQGPFILLYDTKLGIMQNLPKSSTDLILKIEILKNEHRWRDW
jgi:hypothetical protein